ncbi:MAG: phosphoribosylamine--glycine ligase, partial [Eudoraea sp.]|nr:phosphoribosylamine--glycine ligase [Eudoraea sp.]
KLFVAPGNAGTDGIAQNIPIDVNDFEAIKRIVKKEGINMVVVGPEDPLVNGIHDFFLQDPELKDVSVIGPAKMAATLEGSKEFAKQFMIRHKIPTASYKSFTSDEIEEGLQFLDTIKPPYVLKADGLAAGKGVLIIESLDEAKKELRDMLLNAKFGNASSVVVIEEFLSGIELSCFVLTDGKDYKVLPMAKDYKRIGEGDTGLNTGGMGAISPVPFVTEEFLDKVHERIIKPTIEGLHKDQLPYKGFIFIGLIKVGDDPFVIEYNVRLGDPETEVVIPRIKNDLVELFDAVAKGELNSIELEIDERAATTVMLVSGGYPQAYKKGIEIKGIKDVEGSIVYHAGTQLKEGKILTNGGRVMAITSFGSDFREGLSKSYQNIKNINFDNMYYRKDLGFDL